MGGVHFVEVFGDVILEEKMRLEKGVLLGGVLDVLGRFGGVLERLGASWDVLMYR